VRRPGLLALLLLLPACRGSAPPPQPPPAGGPIVLITFDSLRADVVGAWGKDGGRRLTPNLDALLAEADWAGRAVAPSSLGASSMASLFTGLRPWQHQVLRAADPLSPGLFTLPEAMQAAGCETAGFTGEPLYSHDTGYGQGFDRLEELGKGTAAAERLATITAGAAGSRRRFVWVHIPEPEAPYLRHPHFDDRIDSRGLTLPERVQPNELALYSDPANPLPPERRQVFWAMYRHNVAWADERLGRLLAALKSSGAWDRTLLVVTSTHGEVLGEGGQTLIAGDLGRQLLEVPFAIKLPRGFRLHVAEPRERRVAAARLWATLVEAAGGEVPPAVAPSLFRRSAPPALSELYLTNGANRLSLVDGDEQLLWEARFAPPEPDYYRARLATMRGDNARAARAALPVPAVEILGRLRAAFAAAPPLSGREAPRLTLERWEAGGGSRRVADPRRAAELARLLAASWNAFVPAERPPGEEAREWYTAESP
jgi:arylsulfatase A-like enzyme